MHLQMVLEFVEQLHEYGQRFFEYLKIVILTLKKGRGFKREKGKFIFFITRLLKRADKLPVHWMRRRFAKGKRRDRV